MRNVYIVGRGMAGAYAAMFKARGWAVVDDMNDADLVQFTGGEDVTPTLYGEHHHPQTYCNPGRDAKEQEAYDLANQLGLPKTGICRGGQFLNVMNGGKMYQHVDNHGLHGTHEAEILGSLVKLQVTSTHHQMMRPNTSQEADCHILMVAHLSTRKEHYSPLSNGKVLIADVYDEARQSVDVEAVYYGSTNTLCFQPHPEFTGPGLKEMTDVYFSFIEHYLFGDENVKVGNKMPNSAILPENFSGAYCDCH